MDNHNNITLTKKCPKCKIVKDFNCFQKSNTTTNGLQVYCKECRRSWGNLHQKELTEYTREYRNKNRKHLNKYWEKYRNSPEIKIKNKEFRKIRLLKLKEEVFNKYGGIKCECCGEKEIRFLSIDHIGGGGNIHRKKLGIGGGKSFYNWLKKNNYPSGYRVLCLNCNWGTHINGGTCPHKKQYA